MGQLHAVLYHMGCRDEFVPFRVLLRGGFIGKDRVGLASIGVLVGLAELCMCINIFLGSVMP
jgi:hypothetical protein